MKTNSKAPARKTAATSRAPNQARTDSDVIELVPGLLKISEILAPVDFSDPSKKALEYAVAFAKQFGAKLTLLHVIEIPVYPPEFAYMAFENDRMTSAAREKLEAFAQQNVDPDLPRKDLVRIGKPHSEIAAAARGLKSDLIIIGTHGYTGLKHVLLGSNAERVVRHAPCPVLVVRPKEHEFV